MSQFGTFADAKKKGACDHTWVYDPVKWWSWGKTELRCTECGTRKKARQR